MSIRIIDSRTTRQVPWKNGQGVTLELAIAPPGAGLEDFDWRISSAKVEAAGAFSHFPGIDRSLALLSGAGLRLNLPEPVILDASNPVLSFAGELDVQAELLDGPVQDFNLMSRRGRWQQRLEYSELKGEAGFDCSEVLFIYCMAGSALDCLLPDGSRMQLTDGQGLLLEQEAGRCRLSSSGTTRLLLARLERVGK
ncbi:HutD family protein [Pseudomonas sp. 1928-m]|uniref:HutD/Ves family protein n=1 Tax=Pseudomonas sp. 1928-m TaxID=3033804 RepID=UPI0023DE8159|nr:HutD family protein [Pseudomonas sp. 1928-m]MDF3195658.1 HutD family protein [Pseudomonas sp. 1928-m]